MRPLNSIKVFEASLEIFIPILLVINFYVYPLPLEISRVLVLYLIVLLVFLTKPLSIKRPLFRYVDYVLIVLAIAVAIFAYFKLTEMLFLGGIRVPTYQVVFATLGVILLLEATRRVVGLVLPVLGVIFVVYSLYRSYPYERIIVEVFSYDGIFGLAYSIAISVVFFFLMFGAFLKQSGFGEFLIDLGKATVGGMSGGPAKVSVVSSSLFGTISGSAVANVVGTGTFTIPMMKKLGFEAEVAGAVEAVASTGGQIMPPVMAAAAYIIAEVLQVPYISVAKSALLPAIAYYVGVYAFIDAYAKSRGLRGLPKHERPRVRDVLLEGGHSLVALIVLTFLLAVGQTPMRAAFLTTLLIIPVSFLRRKTALTPRKILEALMDATRELLMVALSCASVGVIVACIGLTGLGGQIARTLRVLGGNNVYALLALVAVTCLIFGMALPTTTAYIIASAITAHALILAGVTSMAAHLFILYWAVLSAITPPVALAAYAGAGIAGANMYKTAITACYLASSVYLIPFVYALHPQMFWISSEFNLADILTGILQYVITMPIALSWGIVGHDMFKRLTIVERILNLGVAAWLFYSGLTNPLLGWIAVAVWSLNLFLKIIKTMPKP
jgi:TRAP transporter 4TM/12TM fusion protein